MYGALRRGLFASGFLGLTGLFLAVACTAEEFASHDAVVVSTPHSQFKDPALYANVKLVVDTRNIVPREAALRVVRA